MKCLLKSLGQIQCAKAGVTNLCETESYFLGND